MKQFKMKEAKPFKWKRLLYTIIIITSLLSIFQAGILVYQNEIWRGVGVAIVPFFIWRLLRSIFIHAHKGNISRQSISLIIEEDFILRESDTLPHKKILKAEIKSIVREEDGGIRIKDVRDNEIWIPKDIQNIDELEVLLQETKVKAELIGKTLIQQEEPRQRFFDYVTILQNNFPVISILALIMIILSYLQLHFYYSLFDINIYNYVAASEIIFGFANLWKESLLIIVYFIAFHTTFGFIKIKHPTEPVAGAYSKRNVIAITQQCIFLSVLILFLYAIIENSAVSVVLWYQIVILIGFAIPVYGIVTVLYLSSFFFKFRVRMVTIPLTFVAVLITAFLMNSLENIVSYKLIIKGFAKYSINLTLSDGTEIKTSARMVFIGSTSNYLFFRNESIRNVIIPRSAIIREDQILLRRGL